MEHINPHLRKAFEQYASIGESFRDKLEWYAVYGRVLCMPEILCLVRECDSHHPQNLFPERADALYIEYLACDKGAAWHLWDIRDRMLPRYDIICYYRGFGNKKLHTMPYERLRNLLNVT